MNIIKGIAITLMILMFVVGLTSIVFKDWFLLYKPAVTLVMVITTAAMLISWGVFLILWVLSKK